MKTTSQQVKKWIRPAESERLEFKQAGRQFDSEKLTRYCVALANEGGREGKDRSIKVVLEAEQTWRVQKRILLEG